MIATLFGVIVAFALVLCRHIFPGFEAELSFPDTAFEAFFVVSLFFSSLPWVWTLFLTAGSETQPLSAAAVRSNVQDRKMFLYAGGVILFSFVGIIAVSQELIPLLWAFGVCVVCAGIILDLLRMAYFRLHYRRSPEGIADWLVETMHRAVKKHDEKLHTTSFETVFCLIVSYMKCGELGALRLFCKKIVMASDLWLGSMAHLSLFRIPAEDEETLLDRYALAEAMTAKRLSWVIKEACDIGSPTALEEVVRFTGRLFLTFHGYHESLGFLLLMTLVRETVRADGEIAAADRDVEVISGFSEVTKALIDRAVVRGLSDKGAILKVLAILEARVKESFRREKTINPALLMQPFAEVGQMLAGASYSTLPDREEIIAELRRILNQFAALEGVTSRLEVSVEGTDTASSFHEDLPFTAPRPPEDA